MVLYRRNHLPGGTFFFTVNLRDRQSALLTDHIDLLRTSFRIVRESHPYTIHAIVVLPEHLHTIWELPPGDSAYSIRWQSIKSKFTHALLKHGVQLKMNKKEEYNLWQKRFWEHTIRDEEDLRTHTDYIHYNPVKHGHVEKPLDWPYSTFRRYVKLGWLSGDWGGNVDEDRFCFGE